MSSVVAFLSTPSTTYRDSPDVERVLCLWWSMACLSDCFVPVWGDDIISTLKTDFSRHFFTYVLFFSGSFMFVPTVEITCISDLTTFKVTKELRAEMSPASPLSLVLWTAGTHGHWLLIYLRMTIHVMTQFLIKFQTRTEKISLQLFDLVSALQTDCVWAFQPSNWG